MIQPLVKAKKQQSKEIEFIPNSIIWLQNTQDSTATQKETNAQEDQYLKMQHQMYLAKKLKMRQQLLKYKLQEFGDSSSDSDQEILMEKHKTKDSSYEPILKVPQIQTTKTKSISQSDKSNNPKKMSHVHVGPGKGIENVDTLDIFVNSKKGVDIWIQQILKFKEKVVKINQIQCSFYEISKVKIYLINVANTSQQCYRVKLNWGINEQFMFAAFKSKLYNDLPNPLYIFARIIVQKLQIMNKNKPNQQSIKPFPQKLIKNSIIYGKILKKSRVINKWSEVFAVINKDGLWYCKKQNDKQKLLVKRTQLKQLWSRFQLQQGYFIIKLCEKSSKIQIGIPISNLSVKNGWLFHIYNLGVQKL